MEQKQDATEKYARREIRHGGYVIEAWAQKQAGPSSFHGVAQFRKAGGDHPAESLGPGALPAKDSPEAAVDWAIKEARARIDSESGQVPMPD